MNNHGTTNIGSSEEINQNVGIKLKTGI